MSDPGKIPPDFKYKEVLKRGKPRHTGSDPFRIRHPNMEVGKRAKIFAPYDALKGFSSAVAAKNVLYENRRELNEQEQAELDCALRELRRLTANGRLARKNNVKITVNYYVPCTDANHEAYGIRGQYITLAGVCRNVDPDVTRTVLVGEKRIPIGDIYRIRLAGS